MRNGVIITTFGEDIEILASSEATGYSFVIGRQKSLPGGGPPPHRHLSEEEMFIVSEGDYEFFDGTSWSSFKKGEVRYSLRGNYHAFRNVGSSPGQMLFMTTYGGLDEYFLQIPALTLPKEMDHLAEVSRYYRYEYLRT